MPGLPMARHEKVSPKRWRILAFADAIWFRHLPLTNRDPELLKRPSPPLVFAKKFYNLVVFREKIKEKVGFFRS